jgi:hypothetical protein
MHLAEPGPEIDPQAVKGLSRLGKIAHLDDFTHPDIHLFEILTLDLFGHQSSS